MSWEWLRSFLNAPASQRHQSGRPTPVLREALCSTRLVNLALDCGEIRGEVCGGISAEFSRRHRRIFRRMPRRTLFRSTLSENSPHSSWSNFAVNFRRASTVTAAQHLPNFMLEELSLLRSAGNRLYCFHPHRMLGIYRRSWRADPENFRGKAEGVESKAAASKHKGKLHCFGRPDVLFPHRKTRRTASETHLSPCGWIESPLDGIIDSIGNFQEPRQFLQAGCLMVRPLQLPGQPAFASCSHMFLPHWEVVKVAKPTAEVARPGCDVA